MEPVQAGITPWNTVSFTHLNNLRSSSCEPSYTVRLARSASRIASSSVAMYASVITLGPASVASLCREENVCL